MTTKYYALYDKSGLIHQVLNVGPGDFVDSDLMQIEIDSIDVSGKYVDENNKLADKIEMASICSNNSPTEDIDEITITCPLGADIAITGEVEASFICDDGTAEITFDVPGQYVVTLSKFPYITARHYIEVKANEV